MSKILVAVLGFCVLAAGAWFALRSSASKSLAPASAATAPMAPGAPARAAPGNSEPSQPKQQLDNVRGAARRIESDADARAKDLEEKMKADP